jgi:hypothetical protein
MEDWPMTEEEAKQFAAELTEFLRSRGVMLWTGVETVPIMASSGVGERYHYVAERPEIGNSAIIRRVLAEPTSANRVFER